MDVFCHKDNEIRATHQISTLYSMYSECTYVSQVVWLCVCTHNNTKMHTEFWVMWWKISLRRNFLAPVPLASTKWSEASSRQLSSTPPFPVHSLSLLPTFTLSLCLSLLLAWHIRSDTQPCCQGEIANLTLTSPGYLQAVFLQPTCYTHTHTLLHV